MKRRSFLAAVLGLIGLTTVVKSKPVDPLVARARRVAAAWKSGVLNGGMTYNNNVLYVIRDGKTEVDRRGALGPKLDG